MAASKSLVEYARERLSRDLAAGGASPEEVEAAIGQEVRRIMKQAGANHNGHHLNGNHLNGNHRDGKGIKTAKKGNKKVVH